MRRKKSYPQKPRESGENTDKSYPSAAAGQGPSVDNLGFWVYGATRRSSWQDSEDTLDDLINKRVEEIQRKISDINLKINSYHTKKVRGHDYLYSVNNGAWTYVGKNDPRGDLKKEKANLEAEIGRTKILMRSCVKKQMGEHLVVDLKLFKERVVAKLPKNVIVLSAVIAAGERQDG